MEHIEPIRQLPNGAVQHKHVQDELKDNAQRQPALHHMPNAQPQQQPHTGRTEHFNHGKKHTERPNRANVGLSVGAVDVRERLCFHLLSVERLDDVHPGDVFLHKLVDARHLVAHIDKCPLDVLLKDARGHQKNRNGDQHHKREAPIDVHHGRDDHKQRQQIPNGIQDAVAEHVGHAIDVADVTGDQGADRGLVEVLQPKLGHVPVQLGSEIEADALGHPIGQIRHTVLNKCLHNENTDHHEKHLQQALEVALCNVDVDGTLNERRPDPHQTGQHHHHHACPHKPPAVWPHLSQDDADGVYIKNVACFGVGRVA